MARSAGRSTADIQARQRILRAAIEEIETRRERDSPEFVPIYEDLLFLYQRRLGTVLDDEHGIPSADGTTLRNRFGELSREMRNFERHTVVRLRQEHEINDELFRNLEHEFDLLDLRSAEP